MPETERYLVSASVSLYVQTNVISLWSIYSPHTVKYCMCSECLPAVDWDGQTTFLHISSIYTLIHSLKANGWAELKLFFVLWWLAVSPVMEKGPGVLDESYVTKETIISPITAPCSNATVILERQWMRFIASLRGKRLRLTKQKREYDMTAAAKKEE